MCQKLLSLRWYNGILTVLFQIRNNWNINKQQLELVYLSNLDQLYESLWELSIYRQLPTKKHDKACRLFLDAFLDIFSDLNLLLKRAGPIIYVIHEIILVATCVLLGRFVEPSVAQC